MQKYLFISFWALLTAALLYLSWGVYRPGSSIMAQVIPEKKAISFHKAVKVKEIYVIPGQKVKAGDPLLKVERQDLLLDVESKTKALENLKSENQTLSIQMEYERKLNKSNLELRLRNIDADIKRLELVRDNQQLLSENIKALNIWDDSTSSIDQSYIDMRLAILKNEKSSLMSDYGLLVQKNNEIFNLKQRELDNNIFLIQEELKLLVQEEKELLKTANQDGIIGNVLAEVDELVTPFSTLISLYDNNPSVIRALVNEDIRLKLQPDQKVIVESTNRNYNAQGTILEIGSRIVEYPSRLKLNQEMMIYGREIFISIAPNSEFLHGEKVFVKIK